MCRRPNFQDTCWNTVQWHLSWFQTTVIMWYCMFWREIVRVGLSLFMLRRVFLSFPRWENSLGISHLQHLRWHVAHHLLSLFHCLPVGTGEQNGTSQGWHDLWVNTSYVCILMLCCRFVDPQRYLLESLCFRNYSMYVCMYAMQCNAMQCNATQCNAMQCNATQRNATQCDATQRNAMQCMYVCIVMHVMFCYAMFF